MFANLMRKLYALKSKPSYILDIFTPDTKLTLTLLVFLKRILFFYDFAVRYYLYLKLEISTNKINDDCGFLISKKNEQNDVLNKYRKIAINTNWEKINAKKPFLIAKNIDLLDKENIGLVRFIMNPNIIGVVSKYLKQIPVVRSCSLWYSPNKEFHKGRSQEFHKDGEDIKQVKVFIPMNDITDINGPLTVINKVDSDIIYNGLSKYNSKTFLGNVINNQKLSDNLINSFKPKVQRLTAKKFSTIFVDTSNCYHYGSRPTKNSKPRMMLYIQFTSSQSRSMPLWSNSNRSSKIIENSFEQNRRKVINLVFKNYGS